MPPPNLLPTLHDGAHDFDPLLGNFTYHLRRMPHEGRGDFYTTDTISGKTILIRYDWSRMTYGTPHFEQPFSPDGGRTWGVNPCDFVLPAPRCYNS